MRKFKKLSFIIHYNYVLCTCYIPGTGLASNDAEKNEIDITVITELSLLLKKPTIRKQTT